MNERRKKKKSGKPFTRRGRASSSVSTVVFILEYFVLVSVNAITVFLRESIRLSCRRIGFLNHEDLNGNVSERMGSAYVNNPHCEILKCRYWNIF